MNQQFGNGIIYFAPNPFFPISYVLMCQPIVRGVCYMQMSNGLTQNLAQENIETQNNQDNIDIISISSSSEEGNLNNICKTLCNQTKPTLSEENIVSQMNVTSLESDDDVISKIKKILDPFIFKAPQVNRRGRPKKPCQKSLSEILEKLKENICRRVRKISEKSNVRSDSRRIQLVRIARKIPLAILNIVELKSKFKTSTEKYFMEAYLNAFLMFLEIIPKESQEVYFERFLKKYGSIDWVNNKEKILKPNKYIKSYDRFPDEFYLFCKTSFPKKKIETMNSFIPQSSNNMHHNTEGNEDDSIVLRGKTTKCGMVQMISSNIICRDCLSILYSFCKDSDCLSKDCESVIKELLTLTQSPDSIIEMV